MNQFLASLLGVCLFRSKPQDIPASRTLLWYAIGSAFVAFSIRNTLLSDEHNAALIGLFQVALIAFGLWVLLRIFSKSERLLQCATAFFGCSALVVLFLLPFLIGWSNVDPASSNLGISKSMVIATSLWYFAIIIFILKETLETSIFFGFVIALVLELSLAMLLDQIFGNMVL